MKHRIGESGADIAVLLEKLAGSERARRAAAVLNVVAAAMIGLALPTFLVVLLARERTQDWAWWAVVALAIAGPVCAFDLVLRALGTYVVTAEAISLISPFRFGSWRIARADIFAIDLEISEHGPILYIVPRSGRVRPILLLPGFHERLARLYPEIGTPGERVELSPRLGRFVYALLAVVITAFIVLLVVLAKNGLLTWK